VNAEVPPRDTSHHQQCLVPKRRDRAASLGIPVLCSTAGGGAESMSTVPKGALRQAPARGSRMQSVCLFEAAYTLMHRQIAALQHV